MPEGYVLSEQAVRQLKADHLELRTLLKNALTTLRQAQNNAAPVNGYRFSNVGTETIPAYGVMRITGVNTGYNSLIRCRKPNEDDQELYLVNGNTDVIAGAEGWAQKFDEPNTVLFDSGTPEFGQHWGPSDGSWQLTATGHGFTVLGIGSEDSPTTMQAVQLPSEAKAALLVDFTIAWVTCDGYGNSTNATVNAYYHGIDPGATITVYDRRDCVCNAPVGTQGMAVWNTVTKRYEVLFLRQWVDVVTGICTETIGSPPTEQTIQVVTPVQVLCVDSDYSVVVSDCGEQPVCPEVACDEMTITLSSSGCSRFDGTVTLAASEIPNRWEATGYVNDDSSGSFVENDYIAGFPSAGGSHSIAAVFCSGGTYTVQIRFTSLNEACPDLLLIDEWEPADLDAPFPHSGTFTLANDCDTCTINYTVACTSVPADDPFTPPECTTGTMLTYTYETAGDFVWTAPAAGKVFLYARGAGGGGAGSFTAAAGAGGGGGAVAFKWAATFAGAYAVAGAATLDVHIEAAGAGGAAGSGSTGGNGGISRVKDGATVLVQAAGGTGASSGTPGAGGLASASVGTDKFNGGAGGSPFAGSAGGGGGGGGVSNGAVDGTAGGTGSQFGGGTGGVGEGATGGGPGQAGNAPPTASNGGGGGGGGGHASTSYAGGAGAVGTVTVYFCPD